MWLQTGKPFGQQIENDPEAYFLLGTLSLVRRPAAVRTAQQRFEYLSGYRHALVELSDSLSASLYDPATVS